MFYFMRREKAEVCTAENPYTVLLFTKTYPDSWAENEPFNNGLELGMKTRWCSLQSSQNLFVSIYTVSIQARQLSGMLTLRDLLAPFWLKSGLAPFLIISAQWREAELSATQWKSTFFSTFWAGWQ